MRNGVCQAGCYMPHLCSGTPELCLMQPKAYYPLFADLNGRRCVVVGGGLISQRKVTTLLSFGADITVVSPVVTKRLSAYARTRRIRLVLRRFRPGDLAGAWLVYAATDDPAVNGLVYRMALRRRVFANVVDQTPLCTFIAPAMVRRGALTAAISTGGGSPSLAKLVRDDVGRILDVYAPMLGLLRSLRGVAKRAMPNYGDRKRYFDRLIRSRALSLTRAGHPEAARREALSLLKRSARNGTEDRSRLKAHQEGEGSRVKGVGKDFIPSLHPSPVTLDRSALESPTPNPQPRAKR